MACSLIKHKRISTTTAKAKSLKMYVEPILTKSKMDSTHSRRVVFSMLRNKEAVTELFRDIAVKIANRPGGYTRILRTGTRLGDAAEMCIIELVDYNENMLKEKEAKKSTRTRRSRKTAAPTAEQPVEEVQVAEAPVEEAPKATEQPAEETPKAADEEAKAE